MLLAIDTSVGCSVAVVDAGRVCAEFSESDTRHHAEVIGVLVEHALRTAGVTPVQLDAVAAGMGPGPFTGLRVGIAAAHAFALGAQLPLLPVVSHDAIALARWNSPEEIDTPVNSPTSQSLDRIENDTPSVLLVTTDARRREAYWSCYDGLDCNGLPLRTAGPGLARIEEFLPLRIRPVGEKGLEIAREKGTAALPAAIGSADHLRRVDARTVSAAALGLIAERRQRLGIPPEADAALYLRSPDVTPAAGVKRVSR